MSHVLHSQQQGHATEETVINDTELGINFIAYSSPDMTTRICFKEVCSMKRNKKLFREDPLSQAVKCHPTLPFEPFFFLI